MNTALAISKSKTDRAVEEYLAQYAAFRRELPGAKLPWLASLRDAAMARVQTHGLPTSRLEAWKFIAPSRLTDTIFAPAQPGAVTVSHDDLTHFRFAGLCELLLVFVDGRFRPDLSDPQIDDHGALPAGVRILSFAQALREAPELVEGRLTGPDADPAQVLTALNTALAADGVVVHLAAGAKLTQPVHLLSFSTGGAEPQASHLRNVIIAEADASGTVVESYATLPHQPAGRHWTNAVTQVFAAPRAVLRHVTVQAEPTDSVHTSASDVVLEEDSCYDAFVLAAGASFGRREVRARLIGDRARATLNGVYLGREHQQQAQRTDLTHIGRHTVLSEVYKGVFEDRSHGAFLGRIHVAPGAIGTDAQQANRNLLLSDHAVADSKPELEILADDVKCAHGATVGDLEREPLFYLRTRGIAENEARAMLIEAFAVELIDAVEDEPVRAHLRNVLNFWLQGMSATGEVP